MKSVFPLIQPYLIFVFSIFASYHAAACTMTASISLNVPNPGVVCVGDIITISAIVNGGTAPYTYSWSNGMNTQSFSVPAPFNQTLILNVTDAAGCTALAILHIKIDVWAFNINYTSLPICQGESVALIISTTAFLPGTTYLWSTGETTPIIYVTTSGTYSATMMNPNVPCVATNSVTITFLPFPVPAPQIVGPTTLCPGQTATLSVAGGPFSSYTWSTGSNQPTIQVSDPGLYTVIVENSVGCLGMDDLEILPGDIPPPILSGPSTLCPGQTGTIIVTNSSSYSSFLWNTGATTPAISVNSPGTYTVTVTNAGGCTAEESFTIAPGSANITLTGAATPVTSCIAPNGSINLTVTPPGSYTFSWSNGASTEDINSLPSGSYTVTVTTSNGCTSSATYTVANNSLLPVPTAVPSAATCGESNGAVSLTVTPPGAYTFLWSNGATTQNLSNIPAGNYSVTVTGSGGCTGQASATVPDISFIPEISGTASPNTLCIGSNGSISLTVSPSNTYTFNWSNGATTQDILNLAAGTYSVTVSAGGSCFDSAIFTVDDNTLPPGLSANVTPSVCGLPNGAIGLTVSPGGTYQFNWSNGANTEDLTGLLPGNYSVTVTSPISGCTATAVYNLPNVNTSFSITGATTPVTNCGLPNGTVDISVFPSGAYSFSWSNGSTTEDLTGVPAGAYSVTVTEAGACSDEASFTVEEQLVFPSVSQTVTAATCGQSNGAIDLSVTPSGGYNFLWSNGNTNEDLSNVLAGNYAVTVTGTNACTATAAIDIPNDTTIFILSANLVANTSCTSANGAIDLMVFPTGSYLFAWSNGALSEDLQNIAAGSFSVTVTEGATCTSTATFEVPDESGAPDLSVVATQSVCGENNGSLDVSISPSGIYDYLWSTGDTTEDLTDLVPGSYSVTVTDINGCSSFASTVVADSVVNFSATGSILPNNSCVAANGSIGLTMSIPGNFAFLWSNGATSQDLQGLAAGSYSVTVALGITCDFSATYDIPDLSESPVISENSIPAMCGQTNGAIDLSVVPAIGNTFLWSNGATTEDLQNIAPGIYSVACTGANGCISTDTVEVLNENTVISLSALSSANTNCVNPNGALDLIVSATGSYTILWSNGATTEDISGLPSGNYSATVTDNSGCSETVSATVDGPVQPTVTIGGPTTTCEGEPVTLQADTFFLTYLWSNGATDNSITVSQTGTYTVTVTNAEGCMATASQFLNASAPPVPVIVIDTTNCDGTATLDAGQGYASYLWSNGSTASAIAVSVNGAYSVTVSDSLGCTGMAVGILVLPQPPQVSILGAGSICQGDTTILSAPGNFDQYLWSTGEMTPEITIVEGGAYSVTVIDANGCTATDEWIVAQLLSDFVFIQATACIPQDTGTVQVVWSNQFGCDSIVVTSTVLEQPVFTVLEMSACEGEVVLFNGVEISAGGSQDFVFTGANGCDSIVSVYVLAFPPVHFNLTATETCWNSEEGSISVWMLSGQQPFQYSIDGRAFQDDPLFTGLAGGNYTVEVMDANGCMSSQNTQVPQTPPLQVVAEDQVLSCDLGETTLQPMLISGNPDDLVWTWSDGSHNPWLKVKNAGIYIVQVDDGCQAIEIPIEVFWEEDYSRSDFFYIPNCFTPNGDGINDVFRVFPGKSFEVISFEFRIFDRWGDEMFATFDATAGWDGVYRGIQRQPAVYVWFVKAKVLVCGAREIDVFREGGITIVK